MAYTDSLNMFRKKRSELLALAEKIQVSNLGEKAMGSAKLSKLFFLKFKTHNLT